MAEQTYVYDGAEVVKTGRVAKREAKGVGGKVISFQLVEVRTLDNIWTKWVKETDLYLVQEVQDGKDG